MFIKNRSRHCRRDRSAELNLLRQSLGFLFQLVKISECTKDLLGVGKPALWNCMILVVIVIEQAALTDQWFLHLADHKSHLGNFQMMHTFWPPHLAIMTQTESGGARDLYFEKSL